MKATMGVYLVRHKPTGKVYIGSSFNVEARWRYHCRYQGSTSGYLWDDWRRDGSDAFELEIIEPWDDRNTLYQVEQRWIDHYIAAQPDLIYNKLRVVQPHRGVPRSTIRKLADALGIKPVELMSEDKEVTP